MRRELTFLVALWKANLLSAMEYRVAFLSQVAGMMLNNAIYFVFWLIFFDRFKEVQGWGLNNMLLLFGLVATGFGLAVYLFGNVLRLADVIAGGRLDYYLSLPRPVLLHVLASGSRPSGLGDVLYGLISFALDDGLPLLPHRGAESGFLGGEYGPIDHAGHQRHFDLLSLPYHPVRWLGQVSFVHYSTGRLYWRRAGRIRP